jgi:hypothetical protein
VYGEKNITLSTSLSDRNGVFLSCSYIPLTLFPDWQKDKKNKFVPAMPQCSSIIVSSNHRPPPISAAACFFFLGKGE